jgi:hypothetical protein
MPKFLPKGPDSPSPLGGSERVPLPASRIKRKSSWSGEPELRAVLKEPAVRMLMAADDVTERDLLILVNAISDKLCVGAHSEKGGSCAG